ncbi:GDP-mannose 4,6-dehydratase [Candidatus Desantisbacteria bacterium]|nr:GDP-mannose 4,6-dehydratase [Candidatus Desantisbacteria bacterium]
MRKILVTGGAGFIGSHIAEYYAKLGNKVVVLDNLSRLKMFNRSVFKSFSNWEYLKKYPNIELIFGDIRDFSMIKKIVRDVDVIFHAAAQTAVTTSVTDPHNDFTNNAIGTFHVLEAARQSGAKPSIIFCSTNKVYGDNVNNIPLGENNNRYVFNEKYCDCGIPENNSIDLCEHTPYGCSKLTGDIYMQDYAHLYGLKIGVFRMSCIYGTRQMGVEDQGWVAWFAIANVTGSPVTIYGDGKQVRDILYIEDLIKAYDSFLKSDYKHMVVNMGGGHKNTISLLELVTKLEKFSGREMEIQFSDWRPSDQKVYISDISKAKKLLSWEPKISPDEGLEKLFNWTRENSEMLRRVLKKAA